MAAIGSVPLAQAQEQFPAQLAETQTQQPNDCVTHASNYHGVNPWLVRGILKVESNFNPKAVNKNRNGTIDVGMAQINSMHFKELNRYGIVQGDLMDGCIASYVAAWHLKKQTKAYGNTWFAVGAYHSATPCYNRRYSGLVWNTLLSWKAVTGGRAIVQSMESCGSGQVAKVSKKSNNSAQTSVLAMDVQ